VRTAEDFMNLPQFRLVGDAIDSGLLGEVTRAAMSRVGYHYHALALLRSWLGLRLPSFASARRNPVEGIDIEYRFAGGSTGAVFEPYRKAEGSFSVVGTKATVSGLAMGDDSDVNAPDDSLPDGAAARVVRVEGADGLTGFKIIGLEKALEISVTHLRRLRDMGLEDDCEFNLLRIDGLCRIISSLWQPDGLNERYRLEDAMADFLVSRVARRIPRVIIPRRANLNTVDLVNSVVGRARLAVAS
jgi:hypothetical protein